VSAGQVTRRALGRLFAGIGAAAAGAGAARAATAGLARVAYHLSDVDRVGFALGNVENHLAGEKGDVTVVLVVNGPALSAFRASAASADLSARLARIAGEGVTLGACGNTMAAQKLDLTDLLPGFVRIDEGGVVRLARLQADGYAYIKP
jgi:intracellular sulfur oxidation DsrE/DsrF family protein